MSNKDPNFKVEAIYFAEFDIHAGPLIRFLSCNEKLKEQIKRNFEEWKEFFIPEIELCRKFIRIFMEKDYSVLAHAVQKKSERYERKKIVFSLVFVVRDAVYEKYKESFKVNLNKLAEYLSDLELSESFISRNKRKDLRLMIDFMYQRLNKDDKLVLLNNNILCYIYFNEKKEKITQNQNKKKILKT